jgi:drug/metabolite transporter (DMT)-like permease
MTSGYWDRLSREQLISGQKPRAAVGLVLLVAAVVCLVAALWLGVGLLIAGAVLFAAFVVAARRFMRIRADIARRRGSDGTGTAF